MMMTHIRMLELVDMIFAEIEPGQSGELAEVIKEKVITSYSTDQQKIVADEFERVGITIAGIPCKRSPL